MSDLEADTSFSTLPARLKRRIDHAFNITARESDAQARKRRKLGETYDSQPRVKHTPVEAGGSIMEKNPAPGGFSVDDAAPGGFFVDDSMDGGGSIPESASTSDDDKSTDRSSGIDYINLSDIPSTLQLLDLQPDDGDVLSVFRNAATGWENKHVSRTDSQDDVHLRVSRKDWRAVCAALLDVGVRDGEDEDGESAVDVEMQDEEDEGAEEEEYSESESCSSVDGEDSDYEYQQGGFVHSKSRRQTAGRGRKRRGAARSSISPIGPYDEEEFGRQPNRITERQKTEARRAFALFFPGVPDEELDGKRIMIKDIARIATVLKEKLTTEDVRYAIH